MNKSRCLSALLLSAIALAACHPSDRCGEGLVFSEGVCRKCPAKSTWSDGTCVCDQPERPAGEDAMDYYRFDGLACVLINDADLPPMPDAGAHDDAGDVGATCGDYCAFANTCIAGNAIAASVIADVIDTIHADDETQCTAFCEDTVGGDGSRDPAVACITNGHAASMCDTLSGVDGLTATLTLVGECCGPRNDTPLCAAICSALKANATVGSRVEFCD